MISYKAVLTATVVAIVTVLATGGVASAHTERYASKATAHYTEENGPGDYFSGRVISEREGCESLRIVKVYRRQEGPDEYIGTTRTHDNGNWFLVVKNPQPGVYYAVATRKFLQFSLDHRHICRRAVSNDVVVG